jgi:hypothetical protein
MECRRPPLLRNVCKTGSLTDTFFPERLYSWYSVNTFSGVTHIQQALERCQRAKEIQRTKSSPSTNISDVAVLQARLRHDERFHSDMKTRMGENAHDSEAV